LSGVEQALGVLKSADVEVSATGDGPPLVFLHGEDGLLFCEPFLTKLAEEFTVIAPSHPGWAGSERTERFRGLDDIAYLYLDVLDVLAAPAPLVGCSLGGWLALELATKSSRQISALTLVAPLGVRTGAPTVRHYLDRYAVAAEVLTGALYGSAGRGPDLAALDDDQLFQLARAQESTAYYTWEPYLHNPSLPDRLHRVGCPTLIVSGGRDGLILADNHVETISSRLGGPVEKLTIPEAGHRVEEQAPEQLATATVGFIRQYAR
jgi:pimeloyl-ACP methyl ester carboxylesterase